MGWFFAEMVTWIAQVVVASLDAVRELLRGSMFPNPDVTVMPQTVAIARQVTGIVNTCYVLAIVTAGILIMTGGNSVQARYTVKDLTPRLVVSLVAANLAVPLCRQLIRVTNAVTSAITAAPFSGGDAVTQMATHVTGALSDPANAVLAVVIAVLIVVLLVALTLGWLMRVATLIILVGVAPAALACYCLPQTEQVANLWWRAMAGCLITPALQVLTLYTGIKVFLDPAANVPALLGVRAFTLWNLFVVVAILMTAVKIPSLVRRYVLTGPRSGNRMAVVMRLLVVEPIARSMHLPGGARRLMRGVR